MLDIQFIIELIFSLLFYFSGMYHFIMGLSNWHEFLERTKKTEKCLQAFLNKIYSKNIPQDAVLRKIFINTNSKE